MFTAFLIKYAEIGIKGRNRYLFEEEAHYIINTLNDNAKTNEFICKFKHK